MAKFCLYIYVFEKSRGTLSVDQHNINSDDTTIGDLLESDENWKPLPNVYATGGTCKWCLTGTKGIAIIVIYSSFGKHAEIGNVL